jgi:hypothetical protein
MSCRRSAFRDRAGPDRSWLPEPSDGRGNSSRQRRGVPAEGPLELAAVDHPGALGLIQLLLDGAQGGIERSSERDPPPGRRPQAGRVAGGLEDHLDEPTHRERLGVGDVPHLTQGFLTRSKGDERPGEVLDVGHRVGNVGIPQHLGGPPLDRPGEDPVAHRRQVHVRAEEIRSPSDRRSDPSRLVGSQERLSDPGSRPAVRSRGPMRKVLGEWSVHGAVGVEVVSEYEPRPGCCRSLDDRFP